MATLSADNKLRARVAAVPGTVILVGAGHPDRAIRFETLPKVLKPFLTPEYKTREVRKVNEYEVEEVTEETYATGRKVFPAVINLDRGPQAEAWVQASREVFLTARRDKPTPEPLAVAEKPSEGWSLEEADVPLIENGVVATPAVSDSVPVSENEAVAPLTAICPTCTVEFKNAHGLKIHRMRTKHT